MSAWGIYCDLCGAPDCMCDCLEQLRARNRRHEPLLPPPPPKTLPRWLSFWGPISVLTGGGVLAYTAGASLSTATSIASASILYACIWLTRR